MSNSSYIRSTLTRRSFLQSTVASAGALTALPTVSADEPDKPFNRQIEHQGQVRA